MKYMITIVRAYPLQSALMLGALIFAGIAEGFGLSALLPLLSIAIRSETVGKSPIAGSQEESVSTAERIVNEVLSSVGLTPTIEILLVLILITIVLRSILVLFANKRVGYTVAHIATDLRLELVQALLGTRWEYYLRQPVGALANAMATEAQRACKAYLSGATMTIALIQAVTYMGVAFLISWKATIAAIAAGAFIWYVLKRFVKRARRAGWRQTNLLKSLITIMTDSLQSIKPFRAMAREDLAGSVLNKETERLNKALQKQVMSKEMLRAFQEPMRAMILLLGLYLAMRYWSIPMSTVMVLIYLIARILNQIAKVQQEYQRMVIFESGYWSLKSTISDGKSEREVAVGAQPPVLKKAIRMEGVSFAYGNSRILEDVVLTIRKGKITAILGPSGSGKTTIADLVIGLLRPQKGEIWIDDILLERIDLRKWRRQIGYVPQESWLLHDSVLNNVTLGDPELTAEDANRALRAAGAWEFVQKMPQGINSTVGERGYKISGGQRQRIAIARAIVHKPKLLILDEATTALDPESEKGICDTLSQLRGGITILAISHQAAVLEVADQAYRLLDGAAVQMAEVKSAAGLNSEKSVPDSDRELQMELIGQNRDK